MRLGTWTHLAPAVALLLAGCAASPRGGEGAPNPDDAVSSIENLYAQTPDGAPYNQFRTGPRGKKVVSRASLRREAETMSFLYPSHVPSRFLAGVLAYEFNDPVRAGQHLDHVLHLQGSHPEAAVLRSRIALEEGNTGYATRLLEDQVRLRPDHAGLREAQASAYFLAGDTGSARMALDAAERLGSPAWRLAYNRGLLAEEDGDTGGAIAQFQQASTLAPGHAPSRQRLRALESGTGYLSAGLGESLPALEGLHVHEVMFDADGQPADVMGDTGATWIEVGSGATTAPAPAKAPGVRFEDSPFGHRVPTKAPAEGAAMDLGPAPTAIPAPPVPDSGLLEGTRAR
jgi:hypothetical protein